MSSGCAPPGFSGFFLPAVWWASAPASGFPTFCRVQWCSVSSGMNGTAVLSKKRGELPCCSVSVGFSRWQAWGAPTGVLRHGCTFRLCPPVCGTPEHQQRHRIQRRRNAVCAVFGPRERPSSTLPLCAAGPGRRSRASFLLPEAETGTRPHLPAGRRWSMLCRLFFLRPERFFARLARRATPVPVSDCCVLSVDMPGRRIRLYESFAPPEYFMRICHWNDPNRHSWNQ